MFYSYLANVCVTTVKTILRMVHFMFSSIKTIVLNMFTIVHAITSLTCGVYRTKISYMSCV